MWGNVLEWMKRIKDLLKNPYRRTLFHEEHKIILLVLIHIIKLWMDEALEYGDNYFLRITCNEIDYKTAEIMHMGQSSIASIRKKFMEEGDLIYTRKVKIEEGNPTEGIGAFAVCPMDYRVTHHPLECNKLVNTAIEAANKRAEYAEDITGTVN